MKIPWIDRVVGTVAHDARPVDVTLVTETLDPMDVRVVIAIEYFVLEGRAHDVFFGGGAVWNQIELALRVAVREVIPKWKFAALLVKTDEAAAALEKELTHSLRGLGYGVRLVTIASIDAAPAWSEKHREHLQVG